MFTLLDYTCQGLLRYAVTLQETNSFRKLRKFNRNLSNGLLRNFFQKVEVVKNIDLVSFDRSRKQKFIHMIIDEVLSDIIRVKHSIGWSSLSLIMQQWGLFHSRFTSLVWCQGITHKKTPKLPNPQLPDTQHPLHQGIWMRQC